MSSHFIVPIYTSSYAQHTTAVGNINWHDRFQSENKPLLSANIKIV
jgi:hypothetical protein